MEMDQKKEVLLQKLEERNKERRKETPVGAGGDVGRSDVDSFLANFASTVSSISTRIETVAQADTKQKVEIGEVIGKDLKKLQQSLSESSTILASYEVRKRQSQINELTTQLQSMVSGPKVESKFAFKSRKKTTTADEKPVDTVDSSAAAVKPPSITTVTSMAVSICNQRGSKCVLDRDTVNGQDVSLADLNDCQVSVLGTPSTMHIRGLRGCIVKSLPVATSIFIDDCLDCTFVVACQQLRMHTSTNCRIYLHVTSRGIIEDCSGVMVGPYSLQWKDLAEVFSAAKLDVNKNHWDQLDDFNWLSTTTPSPNWSVIPEDSRELFFFEP